MLKGHGRWQMATDYPGNRFGGLGISRRQVNLRLAQIDQGNVYFDEELAAGEPARAESGLGPLGPGDGDPCVALLLGKRLPTFGDLSEDTADGDLQWGSGVERDKGGVADLPVPGALPNHVPALAGLGVGPFHK